MKNFINPLVHSIVLLIMYGLIITIGYNVITIIGLPHLWMFSSIILFPLKRKLIANVFTSLTIFIEYFIKDSSELYGRLDKVLIELDIDSFHIYIMSVLALTCLAFIGNIFVISLSFIFIIYVSLYYLSITDFGKAVIELFNKLSK